MPSSSRDWYTKWFDTSYYALLYAHRSKQEADAFIRRLVDAIPMRPNGRVLDVPCGWGRHAASLHTMGFDVVGIDINPALIARAKQTYTTDANAKTLRFQVHDMREPYALCSFDYVLNLFTSIGYFETKEQTQQAIVAMAKNLKPEGYFVLDYLHANYVRDTLEPQTHTSIQGIDFEIKRRIVNDCVIKDIYVQDQQQRHHYQERVLLFSPACCQQFLHTAHMRPLHIYGSYDLRPLESSSTRFICIAQRKTQ